MTSFEYWQLEKYGNYIPDNEPEEDIEELLKENENEQQTITDPS